uniref:Uncharacterized protein n=1 Tax=Macrostomum lignano TaxID=282301 RepID=A0A1I8F7Q8_9PLAT
MNGPCCSEYAGPAAHRLKCFKSRAEPTEASQLRENYFLKKLRALFLIEKVRLCSATVSAEISKKMHRLSILLLAAGLLATGLAACCASGAAAAAPPAADSYLAAAASRPRAGPLQERLPLLQAAPSPVGRRGVQHRSGLCGGRDGSCSCGQGWAALREGRAFLRLMVNELLQ